MPIRRILDHWATIQTIPNAFFPILQIVSHGNGRARVTVWDPKEPQRDGARANFNRYVLNLAKTLGGNFKGRELEFGASGISLRMLFWLK